MIARWFGQLDPLLKVVVVCLALFGVLLFLMLVVLPAAEAAPIDVPAAGVQPPATIVAAVPLQAVYCAGPCCCGQVQLVYHGHWYDRPRGYCRWFYPLHDGQVVTTTLYLVR